MTQVRMILRLFVLFSFPYLFGDNLPFSSLVYLNFLFLSTGTIVAITIISMSQLLIETLGNDQK